MRAATGQFLDTADVRGVAREASRPRPQSSGQSATRHADHAITDHGVRAEPHARSAAQRPQASRHILPGTTVFIVIFAFIVVISCLVAPRILYGATHTSRTGVGTYQPSSSSLCSGQALFDGLRSAACAQPLTPVELRSNRCC